MAAVYVVSCGSQMQQNYHVEAVFSTDALARKYVKTREAADGEKRSIDEFELDGREANPRIPWRVPGA